MRESEFLGIEIGVYVYIHIYHQMGFFYMVDSDQTSPTKLNHETFSLSSPIGVPLKT